MKEKKKFMMNSCFKTGFFLSKICPSIGGPVISAYITFQDHIITYWRQCTAMLLMKVLNAILCPVSQSLPLNKHTQLTSPQNALSKVLWLPVMSLTVLYSITGIASLFLVSPTSFPC